MRVGRVNAGRGDKIRLGSKGGSDNNLEDVGVTVRERDLSGLITGSQ